MSCTMTSVTPQQTLIEIRLGGDLAGYVARSRADRKGWRPIAEAISKQTGLAVSHETLRVWYGGGQRTTRRAA